MIGAQRRDKGYLKQRSVWFNSSAELRQGVGVFYDTTVGTLTTADLRRGYYTVPASTAAGIYFAGVASQDYPATTGGQEIVINEPGSICLIRTEGDLANLETVAIRCGTTRPGWFINFSGDSIYPLCGNGAAQILQNETSTDTSSGKLVVAKLLDAGSYVSMPILHVLGSSFAAGGAVDAVVDNRGTIIFDLDEQPTTDLTCTLGNATEIGMRVAYGLLDNMTNDVVVTVTAGVQLDGSTALATLELDGAGDWSVLEWMGPHWKLIANSGTGLA